MAGLTCTLTVHDAVCSDGTTKAADLHVDGPDGSFVWGGGEPQLRSLVSFLGMLRQCDYKVAARLSVSEAQ